MEKSNCTFITAYERDNETELDFAQARMYANKLGRFTSPDDFMNDTFVEDPASWNLYSYTRNSPLVFTDPKGKEIWISYSEFLSNEPGELGRVRERRVQYRDGKLYNEDGSDYGVLGTKAHFLTLMTRIFVQFPSFSAKINEFR